MTNQHFKVGDLVRIGEGRKVYQIVAVVDGHYQLSASAYHRDAATALPGNRRYYPPADLRAVGNGFVGGRAES